VLTGLDEIPVCVGYEVDGKKVDDVPWSQSDFHHATPIYESFPGWSENIEGAREFSDLPQSAQDYVTRLEDLMGQRVSVIGVGPSRDAVIVRHDLLPSS
jgi:Adenylosuccinate synthase